VIRVPSAESVIQVRACRDFACQCVAGGGVRAGVATGAAVGAAVATGAGATGVGGGGGGASAAIHAVAHVATASTRVNTDGAAGLQVSVALVAARLVTPI
jgi:hypothetical protein